MWWVEVAILWEDMPPAWTMTDENVARLVDREDYWLNSEYASWSTDPNDPELKRQQEERKRRGVKPPPTPILQPVAMRPPDLWEKLNSRAAAQLEAAKNQVRKKGSLAQLREALNL